MEEELEGVVLEGWAKSIETSILPKLKSCTESMNDWGRKLRNKYRVEIEECREELECIGSSDKTSDGVRYEEVSKQMGILLAQEEEFWKQRAKVYWLKDSDTNSRFFHAMASAKKRRNTINSLKGGDGETVLVQQELCGVAINYFT